MTSKTPRTAVINDSQNEEEASPIATEQSEESPSPNADDEGAVEITPVPSSPWKIGNHRISKSPDIKAEQMQKALGTFKRFHSEETTKGRELIRGTESRSQDLIKINQKESKKARVDRKK